MWWGLKDYVAAPDNYSRDRRIRIGEGITGDVYKEIDKRTGQEVAIKEFAEFHCFYFIREVTMHIELQNLRVVRLLGFFPPKVKDDTCLGRAFIITELMPNGTLSDMLRRRFDGDPHPEFGPTEWSKAIFGIVFTMMQLHERGVMHRDLQPENVLLDENFEIKIADFGLSRMSTNLEKTGNVGSPLFMAPELLNGDGAYDNSVDVYAFAMLLYQTFTDQQIFEGCTRPMPRVAKIMEAVGAGRRLRRVEDIPDRWWEMITDCWDQSPVRRPSFRMLTERMLDDDLVMEGTDMERYREYQRRLTEGHAADEGHEPGILQPEPRLDFERPALTVARLAAAGHPEFRRIYKKGPSKCLRDLRPFPFKRRK